MKVLLSSLPHLGHVVPMNTLKFALEARGHEVFWEIPEYDTSFSGILSEHLQRFQELVPKSKASLLKRIASQYFDLLITDPAIFAVEEVAKKTGIPWALFSNLPLFYPFSEVPLVIQGSIFEFEQIQRINLVYSGPTMPFSVLDIIYPRNLAELKVTKVPVIYVTQGTVATSGPSLAKTCKKACGLEYFLVDSFMQYAYFMPLVDIFITNGGYGGVQAALYHGVPMIIAGETEDKPIVAQKAAEAGIAIDLKTSNPSPAQLREAISEILANKLMQTRCKQLATIAQKHNMLTSLIALESLVNYPKRSTNVC